MNRTLRSVTAVATLLVLTACTQGAPTGATLPPLTSSATTSTGSTSVEQPSTTPDLSTAVTPPSDQSPVDVTVPPEASALPLPTDQISIPADNAQEKADRAAIEKVWQDVWDLYRNGYGMSPADVRNRADQLLMDPVKSQFIAGLTTGEDRGVDSYGTITLHPYWYRPVGGLNYAVLGDCADYSQYGELNRASGEKTTVGDKNSNRTGQFVRGSDGQWRLWNFTRTPDVACSAP